MSTYTVDCGDCIAEMQFMASKSVQCCVTSPPYFSLRDYGVAGQIGLEPTPTEFVQRLVEVFRDVRRVLRDDGTLWLNLGDSYAGGGNGGGGSFAKDGIRCALAGTDKNKATRFGPRGAVDGLKSKDLIGIPWLVAFALQADGWYLRQDIIWHKPNPMPESVRDRCTKAHEYLFLLSKSQRYLFNYDAMQEPAIGVAGNTRSKRDSFKRDNSKRAEVIPGQTVGTHRPDREEGAWDTTMRNRRSVWTVATKPYKEAHFATFPPNLIEPCILAGSRPWDVVLDPFAGSGTTGEVALKHGRKAALIELNPEYIKLIKKRLDPLVKGGVDLSDL